jgi:ABC-type glycerol-3-phosphate transport system permease component
VRGVPVFFHREHGKVHAGIGEEQRFGSDSSCYQSADWTGPFAALVIVMLPTVFIYVVLSERTMAGITLGAVKG